jgi:hypothetical protein
MNKRSAVAIAIAGVIVFGGIVGVYSYYVIVVPGSQMGREVARAKARLLVETNHRALLETCRELSRQVMNAEIRDAVYKGTEALRLPEPIPALRPNRVTISRDGLVQIGMYTGWWPLGVRAYPEGYPEYPPPFKYGDRELLEGLWYYEDGYSLHPDAYDKIIDELLGKNKMLKGTTVGSDPNLSHAGEHGRQS